jgi:outer membrane protein assembly factor BamB
VTRLLPLLAALTAAGQTLPPAQGNIQQNTFQPGNAPQKHVLQMVWRTPLAPNGQAPQGTPALSHSRFFLAHEGITAYSRKTGKLEWQVPVRKYLPQALLFKNGALLVVEENITALDEKSGRMLWEFTPDANASLGRAAVRGSTLCFGTSSHRVYALDVRSGRQRWVTDVGPDWTLLGAVRGIAMDRHIVYVGAEQWRTENGSASSGWLIALNARTGKELWRYHTGDGEERRGISSSPKIAEKKLVGNLLLASDYLGNAVIAVNRQTGKEEWRFEGERGFVGFPEAPLADSSTVYAASGDKNVYALDLKTGRLQWRTPMPASNLAYTLCGKNLLVSYQGLSALDPRNGKVLESLLQHNEEFPTSDFSTDGNHVFFAGSVAIYEYSCK